MKEALTEKEIEELVAEFLEVESKVLIYIYLSIFVLFLFLIFLEGFFWFMLILGCRGSRST